MSVYRLSHGLQPIRPATIAEAAALIGAGVAYSGDMANASGRGAVVGVAERGAICGAGVDVVLEDGRRWRAIMPNELAEVRPGNRFSLDGSKHGADYIAQLLAGEVAKRANDSAAAELKAAAFRKACEALKLENPDLLTDPADPAKNLRRALKRSFPGVKFSVRRDHYSSIRVHWVDGPTAAAVEAIADRFQHGHFDGMVDCYEYSRSPWSETFGGVDYVFCNRDHTDAHLARAIASAVAEFGPNNAPTVEDFRAGRAWQTFPGESFEHSNHWSWQTIIHRAAADLGA